MWAAPPDNHQTLAETLEAKLSKFGEPISIETYRQVIAVFLAGRGANPVRTGLLFRDGVMLLGEPDPEPEPVPEPEPDEPPVEPDPEPDPEPEPEPPPPPKPRFSNLLYPGMVDAGEVFQIRWATNEATHVDLYGADGEVIAKSLPPAGVYDQRIDADATYSIEAVNGDERWLKPFAVKVRRRSSWLDILWRILGR